MAARCLESATQQYEPAPLLPSIAFHSHIPSLMPILLDSISLHVLSNQWESLSLNSPQSSLHSRGRHWLSAHLASFLLRRQYLNDHTLIGPGS